MNRNSLYSLAVALVCFGVVIAMYNTVPTDDMHLSIHFVTGLLCVVGVIFLFFTRVIVSEELSMPSPMSMQKPLLRRRGQNY